MAQAKEDKWALVKETGLKQQIRINRNLVYWEKFGHGPQVVLCLAGLLGDIDISFHPVWEKMDMNLFTMIGVDLPGYGHSRPPARDYRWDWIHRDDAEVAMELMEELGYKKFSVMTQSAGGVSATFLATSFPEVVEKVVYCSLPFNVDEGFFNAATIMKDLCVWDEHQRNHFLKTYGKSYTETVLQSFAKNIEKKLSPTAFMDDYVRRLKGMKGPVLAIYCLEDKVLSVGKSSELLKEYIPHLRLHKVKDGNHSHLSFLDEYVQVCQDFLKA